MATIVKTPSGTWKAVIRKTGRPTTIKTFRLKKDADDWSRSTENAMVRWMFIQRGPSERMTFEVAMKCYLTDVTPTKRPLRQNAERNRSAALLAFFGKYSLAAITTELSKRLLSAVLTRHRIARRRFRGTGLAGLGSSELSCAMPWQKLDNAVGHDRD